MPRFWEHFGRDPPRHRNLQDGLFQIASQTCSLLVQVNNTNNITYGHHATNIQCNSLQNPLPRARSSGTGSSEADREQLLVLIPPNDNATKFKTGTEKKVKLSVRLDLNFQIRKVKPNMQ